MLRVGKFGPILLVAAALVFSMHSQSGCTAAKIPTFEEWVRQVYGQAVQRRMESEEELLALFTPELRRAFLSAQNRIPPASEPDGPILHFLFGWGVLPGHEIVLEEVSARSSLFDDEESVNVSISVDGKSRQLIVRGAYEESQSNWAISDVEYGASGLDRSLRARLDRMSAWQAAQ